MSTDHPDVKLDGPAVQRVFNTKPCTVCAKGALLASWIGCFDSVDSARLAALDDTSIAEGFPEELIAVFGEPLLAAMEDAFEGRGSSFSWARPYISAEQHTAIRTAFGANEHEWDHSPVARRAHKRRLIAVMENVIANKGALVVGEHRWE